ncbi:MAG TPA: transporter substrate-binding domain-containing protein [Fervidobacterium sp.]|nr:transporter substrate-binding domain-containing protein [Fervidobacterium sp.]HPT53422.1 transporter substrate-binding domain-containing protein [Fervidobacterium sp.]
MRKVCKVLLFVIFLITLSNSLVLSQVLKVGFLLGSPYAFWQVSNFTGIDYEILSKVALKIGYQMEIYVLPFNSIDPSILGKLGLDIVAGGIHVTEERQKTYNFSAPYAESGLAIVLRKGLTWNGDVEGIKFAVKQGATGQNLVEQWKKEGKKVQYTSFISNEEIITELILKRYDAAFFDYLDALYIAKNYGLSLYENLMYRVNLGYIILNKQLEQKINKALADIAKDIPVIISKYVGPVT